MKQEFPDAIILAPSFGLSWSPGSANYLRHMLKDAESRLDMPLPKPWLIGISAGGRGGFGIYNQMANRFQGYVCMANAPETATIRVLRRDLRVLMLHGKRDRVFPVEIARRQAKMLHKRVPALRYRECAGDHFFLLSERQATCDAIKAFMKAGGI